MYDDTEVYSDLEAGLGYYIGVLWYEDFNNLHCWRDKYGKENEGT